VLYHISHTPALVIFEMTIFLALIISPNTACPPGLSVKRLLPTDSSQVDIEAALLNLGSTLESPGELSAQATPRLWGQDSALAFLKLSADYKVHAELRTTVNYSTLQHMFPCLRHFSNQWESRSSNSQSEDTYSLSPVQDSHFSSQDLQL
jgi:hypothetical protein